MKIYKLYIFILAIGITSCNDYLDELPDQRIEIDSPEKAAQLLVSAYPGTDYLFTDWFTDDAEYIETNYQEPLMTASFLWEELEQYDDNNSPSNFWYESYKAIAQANATLEAIETMNMEDLAFKNAIKGEALMCRAYAHFMLASLFCNNYNQASASSDLGIPYVTESEKVLIKDYSRGTLADTYNMIEKDLKEGMVLISDDYYSGSKKYHFTKRAAFAFACRFYLYKNEYNKCITYADTILGTNTFDASLIKDLEEYEAQSGALAKRNFYVSNSDPSNIMLIEKTVSLGLRHNYGYRTSVSTWNRLFAGSIWGGSDLRDNMAYYGDNARNTIRAAKFNEEFYKESLTATTGYPFFVHSVFRGEELVFNRAESEIKLGNYAMALAYLNVFGALRYNSPPVDMDAVLIYHQQVYDPEGMEENIPANALMALLLDEKHKEFIHEGMRWFDIKRHPIEVKHYTFEDEELTLTKNDLRKVLQIPLDASSRGLQKNPR